MDLNKRKKKRLGEISLLTSKTDFSVTEAYKAARTNLLFTVQTRMSKRVLVTSAAPNEGKSTTCCNLGITLAQTDSKVLILDCDLRKPDIHKCFCRECVPGLSELLAGMVNDLSETVRETDYPNLNIISSGTVPPNPAELLGSTAMQVLLLTLSQEYDYILLDSPPVNLVADAVALSAMTDGVVLVAKQGLTTHPELAHALSSLRFANAKVLGIILNGVRASGSYGQGRFGYSKYKKYLKEYK